VPALGMSADYFLPPTPNMSYPDQSSCPAVEYGYEHGVQPSQAAGQNCKSLASDEYSKRGIDSGEIVIRGGSHLDFSFISNPAFGATLRGADLIDWYTTAWFDKYLKRDPTADSRLLTNRWRHDGTEASVDPAHDGNSFSFYHPSRLNFTLANGTKVDCEDLRSGCPALTEADGYLGDYSYLALATSPDAPGPSPVPASAGIYAAPSKTCVRSHTFFFQLGRPRGMTIVGVKGIARKGIVIRVSGSRVTVRLARSPRGNFSVHLRVTLRHGGRTIRLLLTRRYRVCTAG
jgi:hypothetical protein